MSIKGKIKRIWNILFVPTSIKPLKFIILHENVLSIYRNLTYYEKKFRHLIYLRIMIEIAFVIACISFYSISIVSASSFNNILYFYVNSINSIIIMLLAVHYSKTFEKLLLFIEGNNLYFTDDKEYQRKLTKQNRLIKYGLITSNSLIFFGGSFYHLSSKMLKGASINILFSLNARISDCRSVYEYVSLYSILYVISEQVACVTRAVGRKTTTTVTDTQHNEVQVKQFEELSTVFTNIIACSKLFNKIFGLQLVIMLASATAYCIMFLYTMAFLSVKGFHDLPGLIASILKLLTFFFLLILLSGIAQTKQNNVNNLRQQLGKLLITCVTDNEQYKATKSLLRLVSTRATSTRTLGSINVDMTLIPSFIMFITSSAVIALQFNNVV